MIPRMYGGTMVQWGHRDFKPMEVWISGMQDSGELL